MTSTTETRWAGSPVADAVALGEELVAAWGSWSPTMTPDARRVGVPFDGSATTVLAINVNQVWSPQP